MPSGFIDRRRGCRLWRHLVGDSGPCIRGGADDMIGNDVVGSIGIVEIVGPAQGTGFGSDNGVSIAKSNLNDRAAGNGDAPAVPSRPVLFAGHRHYMDLR